jgi:hypothetical protein
MFGATKKVPEAKLGEENKMYYNKEVRTALRWPPRYCGTDLRAGQPSFGQRSASRPT